MLTGAGDRLEVLIGFLESLGKSQGVDFLLEDNILRLKHGVVSDWRFHCANGDPKVVSEIELGLRKALMT